LKIVINQNIEVVNPPPKLVRRLKEKLILPNPLYLAAKRGGRRPWGIPRQIKLLKQTKNKVVIPRGCMDDIRPYISKAEVVDERVLFPPNPVPTLIEERFYQEDGIRELLEYEEGFLKAPAGSGKTVMGLELIARVGQPALWLTHLDRLFKQVLERIELFIPAAAERGIGEIREGNITISDFLTIGMIPSLIRMDLSKWQDFFGMVLVDEAHHVPANTFFEVIRQFKPYHLYGLTATDYRNDGLDPVMFRVVGNVRANIPYDALVEAGQIIRPTIRYVPTNFYMRTEGITKNLYQKVVKKIIMDKVRNKLIAHHVLKEAKEKKICIVISGRRIHCRDLHKRISKEWPQTALAIGDIKKKEVDAAIKAMEDGEVNVLITTFEMLGEGFDLDKLDRLFFTVPFKAPNRVEQGIGRLQRTAPNKKDAVVYEFVDEQVSYCMYLYNRRLEVYDRLRVGVDR
jgi:superfamily II DNA or RNA helicase